MASISKQCVFCLPNTNESIKHKFWDCIQARRAWRWATYIMHELCGVHTGNYDCFNWKQVIFGERIPKKYAKKIKIWHLLRGITLWTIWVERNDKVFNDEQWHLTRVKHRIWDELILYAKAAWNKVLKQIKICPLSAMTTLQGFDQSWGGRGTFYVKNTTSTLSGIGRRRVTLDSGSLVGSFGGLGVVLGRWGGSDPWLGGVGGLSLVGSLVAVCSRPRGSASPP